MLAIGAQIHLLALTPERQHPGAGSRPHRTSSRWYRCGPAINPAFATSGPGGAAPSSAAANTAEVQGLPARTSELSWLQPLSSKPQDPRQNPQAPGHKPELQAPSSKLQAMMIAPRSAVSRETWRGDRRAIAPQMWTAPDAPGAAPRLEVRCHDRCAWIMHREDFLHPSCTGERQEPGYRSAPPVRTRSDRPPKETILKSILLSS